MKSISSKSKYRLAVIFLQFGYDITIVLINWVAIPMSFFMFSDKTIFVKTLEFHEYEFNVTLQITI